jgi:dynactin complex subunit
MSGRWGEQGNSRESGSASSSRTWARGLGPLPILNDNNAAILLSKNPVNHDRSKHIDIRHHVLRDKITDNTIELSYVPTENNLADILTNHWELTLSQVCGVVWE